LIITILKKGKYEVQDAAARRSVAVEFVEHNNHGYVNTGYG
jgi:hypothetical protein